MNGSLKFRLILDEIKSGLFSLYYRLPAGGASGMGENSPFFDGYADQFRFDYCSSFMSIFLKSILKEIASMIFMISKAMKGNTQSVNAV
jgi:hypothetical protein